MDHDRFDGLTRSLAPGSPSRRRLLGGFAASAGAALLGGLGWRSSSAACTKAGRPCRRNDDCCDGSVCHQHRCRCAPSLQRCRDGRCRRTCNDPGPTCAATGETCDPEGAACCNDRAVCAPRGGGGTVTPNDHCCCLGMAAPCPASCRADAACNACCSGWCGGPDGGAVCGTPPS